MVFDLSTQLLASMSWVEGSFREFLMLASKAISQCHNFLRRNRWPWRPSTRYGVNNRPMAASSGIEGSPRPAVLGDVLGTVPPDPHGHQNCSQSRCIFSVVNLMSWITVAKRPCYGQLKINPSYTIILYYVLMWFVYYGGPPTAVNTVLAIIANGGQAIIVIYREAVEIH